MTKAPEDQSQRYTYEDNKYTRIGHLITNKSYWLQLRYWNKVFALNIIVINIEKH